MINNKKILSVITARKGSKGIKNKNIRELMGEPLFMWSVLASVNSEYIDKTVISSNCEKIEKIYIKKIIESEDERMKKVAFIKRPEEISGDLSKNEDALIHAYNWMKNIDDDYDIILNLQPTSPIRLTGILDQAIKAYDEGSYDSLLAGVKDTPFIWQKIDGEWKYTVDKNNCCNRKMRQQFKENEFLYHDCGLVYMVDRNVLLETNCRIGKNPCIFEVDRFNSLQIDEEFDFLLIENLAKVKNLSSLI